MNLDWVCVKCPTGVDCGKSGSTLLTLEIMPGYFRFTPTSVDVLQCPKPLDCVGGNSTGSRLCSQHAQGPLCSSCQSGFYNRESVNQCIICGDVNDYWFVSFSRHIFPPLSMTLLPAYVNPHSVRYIGPAVLFGVLLVLVVVRFIKRKAIKRWWEVNRQWVMEAKYDISARSTGKDFPASCSASLCLCSILSFSIITT